MSSSLFAETLNIKVSQSDLSLPFWSSKQLHYGGVLIIRGGEQAHWSILLASLAKQLAQNGWSVALLNCKEDKSISWIDQLPNAISALRQDNNKRIVIVHYGDQLNVTLDYFNKPQAKLVNGIVLLSAYDLKNKLDKPMNLRFPVFDIAGQFDYDVVLQQRAIRESEIKAPNYLMIEMPGAQHDYQYSKQLLLAFVHGWMAKLPEFIPQPPPILVSYVEPVFASRVTKNPKVEAKNEAESYIYHQPFPSEIN
jgi:hypothetical protein